MNAYDRIGGSYVRTRRTDPRIERQIARALGDARSVVNVGAGIGAYEPSAVMLAQRTPGAARTSRTMSARTSRPSRCSTPQPWPRRSSGSRDVADGTWAKNDAELLAHDEADFGYRLLVAA